MSLAEKLLEVLHLAVAGMDLRVRGDVVAIVAKGRGIEGEEPDRGDTEVLEVVELGGEAAEVPDAVAAAVEEGANVGLIDDPVLVPERVARGSRRFALLGHAQRKYSKSRSLRMRRRSRKMLPGMTSGR